MIPPRIDLTLHLAPDLLQALQFLAGALTLAGIALATWIAFRRGPK